MSNETHVLMDVNNLSHRNWHARKSTKENERVIVGMLRDIHFLSQVLSTTKFVFCFDMGESVRTKHYPQYKANRVEKEETQSIKTQVSKLREIILPDIGFQNLFIKDGYEADDLIGFLCKNKTPAERFCIVSNDQDFFQLLQPGISIWNPHLKRQMGIQRFRMEYSMDPKDWVLFKSLCGCETDNIDGVCGKISAKQFVLKTMPPESKRYQDIMTEENQTTLNQNKTLIELPCPYLKDPELALLKDETSNKKWDRVMHRYNYYFLFQKGPF